MVDEPTEISYYTWLLATPCLHCGEKRNRKKALIQNKEGYACKNCNGVHWTSEYESSTFSCECETCLAASGEETENRRRIDYTYTYICLDCNFDIKKGHEEPDTQGKVKCNKCHKEIHLYKDRRNTPYG